MAAQEDVTLTRLENRHNIVNRSEDKPRSTVEWSIEHGGDTRKPDKLGKDHLNHQEVRRAETRPQWLYRWTVRISLGPCARRPLSQLLLQSILPELLSP